MKLPSQWTANQWHVGCYITVTASVRVFWQFFLMFCPMSSPLHSYCMPVLSEWFSGLNFHNGGYTHTTVLLLFWNMSGTTRVSRYQKGKTRKVKTNLDLLEQEIVSGSGICWAMCKSAPHPRQPCQHPTTQFFTGRMPFLPPNQQRQSTEGNGGYNHES